MPGVLYGGDAEPLSLQRRRARAAPRARRLAAPCSSSTDGGTATPAVLKDAQRHPVRGETMHVDLLRVDLNVAIQPRSPLELIGGEDAPGVKEGGVLEQVTREVNIEALPSDIPESITHDVSGDGDQRHVTLAERHRARRA